MAQVTLAEVLEKAEAQIATHCLSDLTVEAVGLVFLDGSIRHLINQARSGHRFSVSARQMQDLLDVVGDNPIAIYHSHPSSKGVPSNADKAMMAELYDVLDGPFPFLIWGRSDGLRVWLWQDGEALEMEL